MLHTRLITTLLAGLLFSQMSFAKTEAVKCTSAENGGTELSAEIKYEGTYEELIDAREKASIAYVLITKLNGKNTMIKSMMNGTTLATNQGPHSEFVGVNPNNGVDIKFTLRGPVSEEPSILEIYANEIALDCK